MASTESATMCRCHEAALLEEFKRFVYASTTFPFSEKAFTSRSHSRVSGIGAIGFGKIECERY